MATFAVIINNKVTNVIECESKELAETVTGELCVSYDSDGNKAAIGWEYDGAKFIEPIIAKAKMAIPGVDDIKE